MNPVFKYVIVAVVAYFVGTINPSYLIGKMRGFDIRKKGSGNAGASNAIITMGAAVGIFSMLFDIFKAFAVVKMAGLVFPSVTAICELAAVFVIAGHIFPFYMHFKGGKGLAAFGGSLIALDWRLFLFLLGLEVLVLLISNYLCFVPITASIILPIAWFFLPMGNKIGAAVLLGATVIILSRHLENIRRIFKGEELRFSYIWNKDKELEKIGVNTNTEGELEKITHEKE